MNKSSSGQVIKVFLDLETTGTNVKKHSIHQISGCIEIDNEIVEEFNYYVRPNPKCEYEPEALKISKKTKEELEAYEPIESVFLKFKNMLAKYIDRYDPKDKAYMVGYNNRSFDDGFIRAWFEQNGDSYIGSWFWSDSLDVLVLASQYLISRRKNMPSFKLHHVAKELGLIVSDDKLHDSSYDIFLTRQIYQIVTGQIEEI